MNITSKTAACLTIAASASLVSCATLRSVGRGSVAVVRKSTTATVSTLASIPKPKMPSLPKMPDMSLANLLPGKRIKVVEVREKDLQKMPSGTELAQAYQRERKNSFWIFGGPVDFKEPTLPEPGTEMDGSLLPPRMP